MGEEQGPHVQDDDQERERRRPPQRPPGGGIPVPDQPPEPADGEAASFSEPVPLRQSDNNQSRAGVSPDPDTLLRLRALRMSPPPAGHCSIGIENAVPETGAAPGIFQSRS